MVLELCVVISLLEVLGAMITEFVEAYVVARV